MRMVKKGIQVHFDSVREKISQFMFNFTMETLFKKDEGELDRLEKCVSQDEWRSFAALPINSRTVEPVSSLLQKVDCCVFPVSKYFLLICYEKCKRQLVKSLEAAAEAAKNLAIYNGHLK